jgi:membrane protein YdbS with pleckstrin-like domain
MNDNNKGEVKRKGEKGVKAFILAMTALLVIVAAFAVGSYNEYDPNPTSVSITAFVLIVMLLLTAVWYRTKYPGYSNDGTED